MRQASNCCKRILEAAKFCYANKTNKVIYLQKLGCLKFLWISISVLNNSKSVIPPLLNDPEKLSSASDKAKLFAKSFLKNANLDDSGISLPDFPSRKLPSWLKRLQPTLIYQRCLVLIEFQWRIWRSVGLNFHTY